MIKRLFIVLLLIALIAKIFLINNGIKQTNQETSSIDFGQQESLVSDIDENNQTIVQEMKYDELVLDKYHTSVENLDFTIISAKQCTKLQLKEYKKNDSVNLDGELDESKCFFIVEIMIHNKTGADYDGGYNNLTLCPNPIDEPNYKVELYMIESNDNQWDSKDYFSFHLQNNEKCIEKLIYIVEKEQLKNIPVICIDPKGIAGAVIRGKNAKGETVLVDTSDFVKYISLDLMSKE